MLRELHDVTPFVVEKELQATPVVLLEYSFAAE